MKSIDINKEKLLQLFCKLRTNYFNWNNIYIAMTTWFWLTMFFVPIPLRLIIMASTFVGKRLYRVGFAVITSVIYAVFSIDFILLYWIALISSVCITEYKKSRQKNYYNSLALLAFSMIALILLDVSQNQLKLGLIYTYGRVEYPACMYRVFGLFLVIELIRVINALTKNLKISSLIGFNLAFLIGGINYWTMAITNKEFSLSDLQLVRTVASVIESVQIETSDIPHFLVYLGLIALFNIGIIKFKWKKEDRSELNTHAVFGAILLFLMLLVIQSGIAKIYTYKSTLKMGLLSNLVASTRRTEKPSGYEKFLEEIDIKINSENKSSENKTEHPNIIVIMSEAFSDLKMVADFNTNEDYMPFIRQLMKETPSGTVYSSVFGNNTVSSEYEFLTGVPTGLTETGGTIYQSRLTHGEESVVSLLKGQGYYTVGVHPFDGIGYNRLHAWECFGFDEIYFREDFENPDYVRNFISDVSFYDKIIQLYNNKSEQPLFCFGISMQNHATYLTDYEGDITLTDMEYEDVEEYLSLIKVTDQATEQLIEYFSNVDEDTMIVFFGDHQPMVEKDFYTELVGVDYYDFTLEESINTYKIPYFIWTNYEATYEVPEETSINYLPNVMLNAAGLEKDAWFTFTDAVRAVFPVITDNFTIMEGEFIEQDKVEEMLNEINSPDDTHNLNLLKEYQVWAYKQALAK